ncbi:hypothetical protein VTK26DRAFT_2690 [Humicola hyalothermophila]
MCSFIQREYSCTHYRYIASRWCESYTITHKRCPPDVRHYEHVGELYGDCKAKTLPPVPWEGLIKRHGRHTAVFA